MGKNENCASTSLAPGFRFHPTDEELVSYYLKRKICRKLFRFDAIADIDIYKFEPWDLPGLSKLKTRDLEWYFFSGLDRKYGNGSKTNRATLEGYWKTTGKDRPVYHRSRLVGMKKTLVYHLGRAPHGKRSNWVMHEYKLVDEAMEKAGYCLEGVVLCRIFQKSGSGPKNGEKYGAPYVEEEWENDDVLAMVPGDMSLEEQSGSDEAFIEQNDLHQNHNLQLPGDAFFPANQYQEDNTIYVEDIRDIIGNEEKIVTAEGEYASGLKALDDNKFVDFPVQGNDTADMSRNDHITLLNDIPNEVSTNCVSNGTSSDTADDFSFDDGLFLDAVDYMVTTDENALDFGVHGPYMEDEIDIAQFLSFDSAPELMGGIDASQTLFTNENWDNATWQLPPPKQELPQASVNNIASSSQQVLDVPKSEPSEPDIQYPYLGKAGRLLGNIPAPPAFASEFPSKDLAARLNDMQTCSSVHVTAGMIRINDMTIGGSRLQLSFDKTGNVNVLLSVDLPQDVSLIRVGGLFDSLTSILSSKMAIGWSRWMFLCVFVFTMSLKVGSCIYAK